MKQLSSKSAEKIAIQVGEQAKNAPQGKFIKVKTKPVSSPSSEVGRVQGYHFDAYRAPLTGIR